MSLSTRYGFADAPTSAIIGNGSLAWTTSTGALAAAGTSLTVLASAAFPAALEFDVIIGVRDPTTNVWASAEIRHVTVVSGTTWTVSAGSLDHVSGSDISHVLTASALTHNPGALTDTGDLPYLLSTGRMGRLGAPANGTYNLTWASGVPSWTAVSGGISGTIAATQIAFGVGTDTIGGSDDLTWNGVQLTLGADFSPTILAGALVPNGPNADRGGNIDLQGGSDNTGGTRTGGVIRCAGASNDDARGGYLQLVGGASLTQAGPLVTVTGAADNGDLGTVQFYNAASSVFDHAVTATDFIVSGSRFKSDTVDTHTGGLAVYDVNAAAYADFLVWTNANAPSVVLSIPSTGTLSIDASTLTLNSVAVATETYVNAQGFVTASSATAFTNKTGAISQWTNDSNFTTLAAVAGVGYATASSATAFTNKSGNISQWTNDSSFTTLAAVAGVGYLTSVTAHNLLSATHGDTTAGSVARGDVITGQGASPKWVRLAKGSANQVLAMDGTATDVVWATVAAGGGGDALVANPLSQFAATTSLQLKGVISDETGSGALVFATSPTLVTPVLGVATATSLNGNTFTTGTYTLTGQAGKTLTFNGSITLTGTDAQTYTFPTTSATIARTDAANTFTGVQTMTSPALTTPAITTAATITNTNIGAVSTDGVVLVNAQPALTGAQQWSPRLRLSGQGFKSNSVSASQTVDWILENQPVQGATVSSTTLLLSSQVNAAGYVQQLAVTSGGQIQGADSNSYITMSGGFLTWFSFGTQGFSVGSTTASLGKQGTNSGVLQFNTADNNNVSLRGITAGTIQHGTDVNGAAVNQMIQAANGITGQNKTGANLTIASGKGTDLGAVSSLILQTPTVGGATNGTAQALATRLTIDSSGLTIADAMNLVVNATTGTKIGTATSQKLGFWNATPIIQPVGAGQAAYTDSTGGVAAASLVDVTTAAVSDPVKVNANFATVSVLLLAIRTALLNTGLMKGAA